MDRDDSGNDRCEDRSVKIRVGIIVAEMCVTPFANSFTD